MSSTNQSYPSPSWSRTGTIAPVSAAAAAFVESVQELLVAAALAPVEADGAAYLPDTFLTRW